MFNFGILFSLVLFGSIMFTGILINQLILHDIVDRPNYRRSHKNITPRGGGLVFVILFSIALPLFEYSVNSGATSMSEIVPIFLVIAMVSFWDDVKTVPIIARVVVHLTCSGLAIYLFLLKNNLLDSLDPRFTIIFFTVLTIALTAFLNIYNFLDGIDGITAAQSIHLTATIIILCYLKHDIVAYVNIILAIAVIILAYSIGFMLFNWYPAKIFIGDVGSIGIGFLLGLCLLIVGTSSLHLLVCVIIASLYYTADGGLTLILRIFRKEKFWEAHLNHFFQQAVKKGMSQKKVVLYIALCNLCLMALSVSALYYPLMSLAIALFVVMITLMKFKGNADNI